jgi:hypothetical protein
MILKITVGDNDFTEELENFASDLDLYAYTHKLSYENTSIDALYDHIRSLDRFRELFYQTDTYTPELAAELCEKIKQHWELWVKHCMKNKDWWTVEEAERIKSYLIRDFKVKFQKSLTPKWENGEVVYICCGYPNRWWTF